MSALPLSLADKMQAPAIARTRDDAKARDAAYIPDASVGGPEPQPGTYEEFAHPAAVEPQRTVWLPRDALGLAELEEQADRAHGIQVSTRGAWMDAKGHVEIEEGPPDGDVRV